MRAVKYRLSFYMAEWCNSNTTFQEIVENGAIPFPAQNLNFERKLSVLYPITCSVIAETEKIMKIMSECTR